MICLNYHVRIFVEYTNNVDTATSLQKLGCHLLVGILVSQLEYAESVIDWLQHAEMLLDHKKVESGHMPSC